MAQMRVGAMALVLSLALLTGASAQAAQPKTFTVERSFSISHVQVPPIC